MARITVPRENTVLTRGQVSQEVASRPGQADIAFGKSMQQLGKAFMDTAKPAEQTGAYSQAYSKGLIEYSRRIQERTAQVTDENGNPTFGTLSQDVERIGREVMEEIGGTLTDDAVRQKFNNSFNMAIANKTVGSMSTARNQQLQFARETTTSSLDALAQQASVDNQADFDLYTRQADQILDSAVKHGALSPTERAAAAERFRAQVTSNRADELIRQDPESARQIFSDPEMSSQFGLDEDERLAKVGSAERAVAAQQRAVREQQKSIERQYKESMRSVDKIIEAGLEPDKGVLDELIQGTKGTALEADVEFLLHKKRVTQQFAGMDQEARTASLDILKQQVATGEELELIKQLERIDKNLATAKKSDVVAFAMQQKIIPETQPIDFNAPLPEQLQNRRILADQIESHYGERTSGLTKTEVSALKEKLEDSTYKDAASILGAVVEGYGDKSLDVFDDLAKQGSVQYAFIGSLVHAGDSQTAATILRGRELTKTKAITNPTPAQFRSDETSFADILRIPEYADTEMRSEILKSARSVYAALSADEGDFSGELDRDRYARAISLVTNGGAIPYNPGIPFFGDSDLIEPPVQGMTGAEFEDFMNSVTDQDIQRLGGFLHMDEGAADEMRRYSLKTAGRGQYFLFSNQGGQEIPILNKEGRMFVLDYNELQSPPARDEISSLPNTSQQEAEQFLDQLKQSEFVKQVMGISEFGKQVIEEKVKPIMNNFLDTIKSVVSPKASEETLKVLEDSGATLEEFGIDNPTRMRHFLAQMSHESAGFSAMVERRSDASAENKYGVGTRVGKILGNTQPGDGAKFKGRGYIQLTGRDNYTRFGKKIGVDLVSNPELAARPDIAIKIAAAFWESKGLNSLADKGNLREITRRINGGYNGLADRQRRFDMLAGL